MAINLFCLPSAGSSASLFSRWSLLLNNDINLIPLEYPGHGTLVKHPLTDSPEVLTRYIIDEIYSYGTSPFILFGHSVGAALAWRVEQEIRNTILGAQLKLLVISGRPELAYSSQMAPKGGLDREGLIDALIHYNAVPQELLENNEMLDFFLPILSNDFRLNDHMLLDEIVKTDTPLMTFFGIDDPDIANHKQMDDWQIHSTQWRGSYALAGDHFFFNQPNSLSTMLDKIYENIVILESTT